MATYEEFQQAVRECCELEERLPVIVENAREKRLPDEWIDRLTQWSQIAIVYLQGRAVTLDGMLEYFDGKKKIPAMDSKELEWMLIVDANSYISLSDNVKEKTAKFLEAIKTSNTVLLEFLMLADASFDPSMKNNWAMRYLVRQYNADILCILLKDTRVDPTVDECRMYLHVARDYRFNQTLMERLVQNPHVNKSELFRIVTRDKYVKAEVVNYLATLSGIPLSSATIDLALSLKSLPLLNECLKQVAPTFEQLEVACNVAYLPVIDRLLQDERINQDLSPLFLKACKEDRFSVAECLIRHPNVNPGFNNNEPLRVAATWGNIEIVALLMKDESGRVDVSADGYAALKAARGAKYTKIIELLMSDPFALEPITDFAAPVDPHIHLDEVVPDPGFVEIPNGDAAEAPNPAYVPIVNERLPIVNEEIPIVGGGSRGGGVGLQKGVHQFFKCSHLFLT